MEQNTNTYEQVDIAQIKAELERLQQENAALRGKLAQQTILTPKDDLEETVTDTTEESKEVKSGLLGIINSNRDHSKATSWGKNQFNNSFPIGLISYMASIGLKPIYLKVDNAFKVKHTNISFEELTGCAYDPAKIYYEFESSFSSYKPFSSSPHMPSIDVIVKNNDAAQTPTQALEIKLTTLPDSTTCELAEDKYGSELVVRPDTIVYQALSISRSLASKREEMKTILNPVYEAVTNWEDSKIVAKNLPQIIAAMSSLVEKFSDKQSPLLLQPVWKTEGKAAILAENCLDVFVWSDFSLMKLFIKNVDTERLIVSRNDRTIVWLFLMLCQFAVTGKVNHTAIIDRYTYGTKNDKAFAVSGKITNNIMGCPELTKPRIKKTEIKNIILGKGQEHLSPERRFDGVIQSDVSIFQ